MFSDNVDDGAEPAPVPAASCLYAEKITIPMNSYSVWRSPLQLAVEALAGHLLLVRPSQVAAACREKAEEWQAIASLRRPTPVMSPGNPHRRVHGRMARAASQRQHSDRRNP
jgi:hypothetical protein